MTNIDQDTLDTLKCDIGSRPVGAPSLDDILPGVRELDLQPEALVIRFEPAMLRAVEEFAAAERHCCSNLEWQVNEVDISLTISAQAAQLDALAQLFKLEASS